MTHIAPLNFPQMRKPCVLCGIRRAKLPGEKAGFCIPCYQRCAALRARLAATANRWTPISIVSDPCMACDSSDVDADGATFWCNGCGISVQVASHT